MPKRLIVLAGLHKTGTSSIQNACAKNRNALMEQGISYPLPSLGRGTPHEDPNHSRLIRRMFKGQLIDMYANTAQIRKKDNTRKEKTRQLLVQSLKEFRGESLIIAAENISTLEPDELVDFNDFFESFGFEINVFCCLRKPKQWLNSLVAQRVAGKYGPGIVLDNAINEYASHESLIKARALTLRQWQPKTHFFSFEQSVSDPDGVFAYFLRTIGADPIAYVSPKDNSRYSDLAVRLVSSFMKPYGHRYHSQSAEKLFLFLQHTNFLRNLPGSAFSLLESEIEPLKQALVTDNDWLRSEFGESFADPDLAFPQKLEPIDLDACKAVLQKSALSHSKQASDQLLRYLSERALIVG